MTTNSAGPARAHARAQIQAAISTPGGRSGLVAAFRLLNERVRRYGPALTEDELAQLRQLVHDSYDRFLAAVDEAASPDRAWPEPDHVFSP